MNDSFDMENVFDNLEAPFIAKANRTWNGTSIEPYINLICSKGNAGCQGTRAWWMLMGTQWSSIGSSLTTDETFAARPLTQPFWAWTERLFWHSFSTGRRITSSLTSQCNVLVVVTRDWWLSSQPLLVSWGAEADWIYKDLSIAHDAVGVWGCGDDSAKSKLTVQYHVANFAIVLTRAFPSRKIWRSFLNFCRRGKPLPKAVPPT